MAHAAGSWGRHPPETHVVVLSVTDEPSLRELSRKLDAAGVERIEKDGFEADDIIGTITKIFENNS